MRVGRRISVGGLPSHLAAATSPGPGKAIGEEMSNSVTQSVAQTEHLQAKYVGTGHADTTK